MIVNLPKVAGLQPQLDRLEANPDSVILLAIEQPEVCNFGGVTWAWLSKVERQTLKTALERARKASGPFCAMARDQLNFAQERPFPFRRSRQWITQMMNDTPFALSHRETPDCVTERQELITCGSGGAAPLAHPSQPRLAGSDAPRPIESHPLALLAHARQPQPGRQDARGGGG